MTIHKRFLGWTFTSAFLFLLAPFMAQAVGISPVLIEAKGLLQNSSVSRKIYLTRSNPAEEERGIAKVLGPAAKYIRLPNNGEMVLPKGMYNTAYEFFIEPGTLGKGDYTAQIQVAPMAAKGAAAGSGSAILTGAQADIHFSVVTEAVESFEIGNPVVRETEEGQILDFTYQLNNKGNVDTRPSKIDVAIRDERDPKFAYAETIDGTSLKIVKALSADTDDVPTKATLAPGSYFMKLTFFGKDKVVFTSRDMRFQVYPRGTLAQMGELSSFATDKTEYEAGEIVGFKSEFKNTGKIGMTATLDISIYQGDKRLEVLSTDPVFIGAGKSAKFDKTYRPELSGDYRAVGSVAYGANKTEEAEALFTVKAKIQTSYVLAGLVGLLIFLAIIVILIVRRKKKKTDSSPAAKPPVTPPTPSKPPATPPAAPVPPPAPPMAPPTPPPAPPVVPQAPVVPPPIPPAPQPPVAPPSAPPVPPPAPAAPPVVPPPVPPVSPK